jgi:hypothetical protein
MPLMYACTCIACESQNDLQLEGKFLSKLLLKKSNNIQMIQWVMYSYHYNIIQWKNYFVAFVIGSAYSEESLKMSADNFKHIKGATHRPMPISFGWHYLFQ